MEGGFGPRYRRSGSLPSSCRDPWGTVSFESCGGAKGIVINEQNSHCATNYKMKTNETMSLVNTRRMRRPIINDYKQVCILLSINATTPIAIPSTPFCPRFLPLLNSARRDEYGFPKYGLFEIGHGHLCIKCLKLNKPYQLDQVFI